MKPVIALVTALALSGPAFADERRNADVICPLALESFEQARKALGVQYSALVEIWKSQAPGAWIEARIAAEDAWTSQVAAIMNFDQITEICGGHPPSRPRIAEIRAENCRALDIAMREQAMVLTKLALDAAPDVRGGPSDADPILDEILATSISATQGVLEAVEELRELCTPE